MNRNTKVALAIVVILLIPAYIFFLKDRDNNQIPSERAEDMEVASFSKSGQILSIGTDSIVIKTGQVERTEGGQVMFVEYEQEIRIGALTKMYVIAGGDSFEILGQNRIDSLRVSDDVTIYGAGRAIDRQPLTASRIEVLR